MERIGMTGGICRVEVGEFRSEVVADVPDHAVAVRMCLRQLTDNAPRVPRRRR